MNNCVVHHGGKCCGVVVRELCGEEKKVSRGLRVGSLRSRRTVAHEEFISDRLVCQQKVYSVDIRRLHTVISYMLGHRLE